MSAEARPLRQMMFSTAWLYAFIYAMLLLTSMAALVLYPEVPKSQVMVHTIKKHGPDRIAGFSPIPAMSMISYASGARLMQLIGGVSLSFYDWYCDLPPASPETWGEQTDVQESADWYHAKMLVSMGANIGMTRTPDCHFLAEGRHNGTKLWVFSPDFNMVAKYADEWVAVNTGQDGAWWMAVNHVLLTEFHHQKKTDYFLDYTRK